MNVVVLVVLLRPRDWFLFTDTTLSTSNAEWARDADWACPPTDGGRRRKDDVRCVLEVLNDFILGHAYTLLQVLEVLRHERAQRKMSEVMFKIEFKIKKS